MLGVILKILGPAGVIAACLGLLAGVQSLRLTHAKHDLTTARAQVQTVSAHLKDSEGLRDTEHKQAVADLQQASQDCSDRVAAAHVSQQRIHRLVEKPVALDKDRCPLRATVSSRELCDATGAHCEAP